MADSWITETQLREHNRQVSPVETNRWNLDVPKKGMHNSDIYDDLASTAQHILDNCGIMPIDIELGQVWAIKKAASCAVESGDRLRMAGANTEGVLAMVGSITSQAVDLFRVEEDLPSVLGPEAQAEINAMVEER